MLPISQEGHRNDRALRLAPLFGGHDSREQPVVVQPASVFVDPFIAPRARCSPHPQSRCECPRVPQQSRACFNSKTGGMIAPGYATQSASLVTCERRVGCGNPGEKSDTLFADARAREGVWHFDVASKGITPCVIRVALAASSRLTSQRSVSAYSMWSKVTDSSRHGVTRL